MEVLPDACVRLVRVGGGKRMMLPFFEGEKSSQPMVASIVYDLGR